MNQLLTDAANAGHVARATCPSALHRAKAGAHAQARIAVRRCARVERVDEAGELRVPPQRQPVEERDERVEAEQSLAGVLIERRELTFRHVLGK